MALSRNQAKEKIVKQTPSDAQFTAVQENAHHAQLELNKEQNRHEQWMKQTDLGLLGKFFGDGKNTQTFIALLAVIFGSFMYYYCLASAKSDVENASFWSENGSKALAFAGTALGYIFGRATTSTYRK